MSEPWIAVDVDGVLADMVGSILPVLKARGHDITREQVAQWDFPLGDTTFGAIIDEMYREESFVGGILPIRGAVEGVRALRQKFQVAIVTARPEHTRGWTVQWLMSCGFNYDDLIFTTKKHATDRAFEWLIDDHILNVKDFLWNTPGKCVLFSQPWNLDAGKHLAPYPARWFRVDTWRAIIGGWQSDFPAQESKPIANGFTHNPECAPLEQRLYPSPEEIERDTTNLMQFSSGAVRSNDKAQYRYDLIAPEGLRRLAMTYAEGAKKYSDHNWKKGMPVSDLLNHVIAHINAYLDGGEPIEDDLAHAAWGLFSAMHFERYGRQWVDCGPKPWHGEVGVLDPEDVPMAESER